MSIVASAKVQLVVNLVAMAVFLVMIPVSLYSGLKSSVPFLVFLSLWALVASHWAGALGALAALRAGEH
jgi:hypothetical protein